MTPTSNIKKVSDPYRWLETENKDTLDWIKKQKEYTESIISGLDYKKDLKKRLGKLYKTGSIGVPFYRGNRYFFQERKPADDLSILYVQEGLNGKPKVLIDPNKTSKDKTTDIINWMPSDDGKFLAYCSSNSANDQMDINVINVETGKKLPDFIPSTIYPGRYITWKPDNSGFWYNHPSKNIRNEEKLRRKLYFHKLGTNFKDDKLVFGKNLTKVDVPIAQVSPDGRFLLVMIHCLASEKEKIELYVKDLKNIKSDFIPIVRNIDAVFFGLIDNEKITILTNFKAPNWKIMSLKIENVNKGIKKWTTVIPENKSQIIDYFQVVKNCLFVKTLKNACSCLDIYDLDGKFIRNISLPVMGSIDILSGELNGDKLFFNFSSYLVSNTVYYFDINSKKIIEFKKNKSLLDEKKFRVKQIWYESKDGTKIPMFVVHKKDLKINGNNPTLIFGYGGFGINTTPGFNRTIIPFLEDGGMYVEVILRGGGEFGEKWHRAGMKDKKQNVFDDFIGAAEYLIKNKYTNSKKIAIFGWSNGGLLTASVIVQRPELFKVAIMGAPITDMIRYHLFNAARYWIQEYGNAENEKDFKYLIKYSPYHNVKLGEKYPATLILTADKDDRVHPMHAYKMTAKLQESNRSDNPILIRIESNAGHSGAASVSKFVEQYSDMWSFIYWQLKINK